MESHSHGRQSLAFKFKKKAKEQQNKTVKCEYEKVVTKAESLL